MADGLAGRVSTRAQRGGGEVAPQGNSLAKQIEDMVPQFQRAMPQGMEATMLARDALTALRQNPDLAKCTPASVLGGLMNIAQLGLRVGVLGQAWLIPLWSSKAGGHEATLVIGYQGLIELAHRSGRIESLIAHTVYENDDFEVAYGLDDKLVHIPKFKNRGEPIAYYAVVKYMPAPGQTKGGYSFYVMSQEEMEDHRDRFAMAKKRDGTIVGPWANHFEEMAKKTAILRLAKYMPKSTEPDLARGIAADQTIRVDSSIDRDSLETGKVATPDEYAPGDQEQGELPPDETAPPDPDDGA